MLADIERATHIDTNLDTYLTTNAYLSLIVVCTLLQATGILGRMVNNTNSRNPSTGCHCSRISRWLAACTWDCLSESCARPVACSSRSYYRPRIYRYRRRFPRH